MTRNEALRPWFRPTTSGLMVLVLAAAVVMGFLKGDLADWVPTSLVFVVAGVAVLATAVGIPWLADRFGRSAAASQPATAASVRFDNLMAVGCVGWFVAAVALLGVLCVMIALRY